MRKRLPIYIYNTLLQQRAKVLLLQGEYQGYKFIAQTISCIVIDISYVTIFTIVDIYIIYTGI